MAGRSREQQLSAAACAAHGKKDRVALRLLDLVDPAGQKLFLQFFT